MAIVERTIGSFIDGCRNEMKAVSSVDFCLFFLSCARIVSIDHDLWRLEKELLLSEMELLAGC
jgi:hypothetical protein